MTKELSAFFDGELEVHEESALWATLKANPGLRDSWQRYKLIGDAIRAEPNLSRDITAGVMHDLDDEPVVLAPRPRRDARWSNVLMAMAASVAGIAVVGWLAFAQQVQSGEHAMVAQAQVNRPAAAKANSPSPPPGMQEYMLAHQANAPGLHLQGGTQHIRTVSAGGGGQ